MKRSCGFTLTELMVTLAIAAILISFAAPSFSGIMKDSQLTVSLNDFISALNLARSDAIRRGDRVTLCKSSEPYVECSTNGGWEQGWIIFVDSNNFSVRDPDEDIIHVHGALEHGISITGNAPVKNYISYINTGVTRLKGGGFQAGSLQVCDGRGKARSIVLNSFGRPRTTRDSGDCVN